MAPGVAQEQMGRGFTGGGAEGDTGQLSGSSGALGTRQGEGSRERLPLGSSQSTADQGSSWGLGSLSPEQGCENRAAPMRV